MRSRSIFYAGIGVCCMAAISFAQSDLNKQQQIESHSRQAQEFLKTNRPDLAAREFRAILALDPDNTDVQGNLGVLLFFQGDYANAAPLLRGALTAQPTLWKIQALLGMCEKRIGQLSSAQTDLEESFPQLQEEKVRIQTGMELIEVYYGAGDLDKAAGIVSVLRQLRPTDVDILYTAHRIYSDLAGETLLSVAMIAPKSARMHQLMAQEMLRQGNTQGAIAHYREALKIDPRVPGLHFELAEVLNRSLSASDKAEVEPQYKAALAVNPFDEKSECRLGEMASRQSDLKAAREHYSRALKLQPNDADANVGLAKVLISTNEPQKAEALLERAVQVQPFNAVIRYHLGTVYRSLERTADSRRELAEFQRLKKMKERLKQVYQEMRLEPTTQERPDPDVPN